MLLHCLILDDIIKMEFIGAVHRNAKCKVQNAKFGFIGETHRNNVGRDDLGTPWQESQCSQFAQRLEGAQILVYVDLWVNLLYNPTIAKWRGNGRPRGVAPTRKGTFPQQIQKGKPRNDTAKFM